MDLYGGDDDVFLPPRLTGQDASHAVSDRSRSPAATTPPRDWPDQNQPHPWLKITSPDAEELRRRACPPERRPAVFHPTGDRPRDLLDRVLFHMYDEEDQVRAETSRHMDDLEVQDHIMRRQAELALECDTPIVINHPDVTSTPRPVCGDLDAQGTAPDRATPTPGRGSSEELRSTTEAEVSLLQEVAAEEHDSDEEMPGDEDDGEVVDGAAPPGDGLNLSNADLGALANSLRQSLAPPPAGRHGCGTRITINCSTCPNSSSLLKPISATGERATGPPTQRK